MLLSVKETAEMIQEEWKPPGYQVRINQYRILTVVLQGWMVTLFTLQPTQPSYAGGMAEEEQTKSPDTGVKGGPSPVDREPCLGGTAGCSEIDECDVKDREDPIGDILKYGEEDIGCQGMNVVDMGDTTGDDTAI